MLSTKKFVSIVIVMFLAIGSFGFAIADDSVRSVAAVVVSYETSSFGGLEIEAVDAEGNVWAYFADEAHFGDLIILEIFDFEELSFKDDEILDVITIGRLTDHEIVQWLIH